MMRGLLKKIRGKWFFPTVVILIYLLVGLTNYTLFETALNDSMKIAWRILPALVLVLILMFLANLFLDAKGVMRYLGRESGLKGWIFAIVGGIISTGSIYMWYPLLKDLKDKGMRPALIATFLYNRAVKIPLLPLMIHYFGWSFTVVLTFYMILFSGINGIVVEKITGHRR